MKVRLIGHTVFLPEAIADIDYTPHGSTCTDLIEFAGRCCYQSWQRPNPSTATLAGYIDNIICQQHLTVLRHASASFYITGISRSISHEIARHHHLDVSELSQRFVDMSQAQEVIPPAMRIEGDPVLIDLDHRAVRDYEAEVRRLLAQGKTRKQAREAARYGLPLGIETRMVLTGNFQAWMHFLNMRLSEHADAEINLLAKAILAELQQLSPEVFDRVAAWAIAQNLL